MLACPLSPFTANRKMGHTDPANRRWNATQVGGIILLRPRSDGTRASTFPNGSEGVGRVNRSDLGDAAASALTWRSVASSHVGTVRKVNEDAFLDRPDIGIWAVADGMGGHQAGDVASRTIVEALGRMRPGRTREELLLQVREQLYGANETLLRLAAERRDGAVIGSTVAILAGFKGQAICLWVGDSRIYLCRGGQLRQLTRDHSQVEELIKLGLLDRDEAETHPQSNIVTRAVGAQPDLQIDMIAGELHDGDVYLICSDGLNKILDHDEISSILQTSDGRNVAERLIERAVEGGARDNVTSVVVTIGQARPEDEVGSGADFFGRKRRGEETGEPDKGPGLQDFD